MCPASAALCATSSEHELDVTMTAFIKPELIRRGVPVIPLITRFFSLKKKIKKKKKNLKQIFFL